MFHCEIGGKMGDGTSIQRMSWESFQLFQFRLNKTGSFELIILKTISTNGIYIPTNNERGRGNF